MAHKGSVEQKIQGLLQVGIAHFTRSIGNAVSRESRDWVRHPDFRTYFAHYLAAGKHMFVDDNNEAVLLLKEEFKLPPGMAPQIKGTYWP